MSQRAYTHLLGLHRRLSSANRAVEQALSLLGGSLQACDIATQQQQLALYLTELAAHRHIVQQLAGYIERRYSEGADLEIAEVEIGERRV